MQYEQMFHSKSVNQTIDESYEYELSVKRVNIEIKCASFDCNKVRNRPGADYVSNSAVAIKTYCAIISSLYSLE